MTWSVAPGPGIVTTPFVPGGSELVRRLICSAPACAAALCNHLIPCCCHLASCVLCLPTNRDNMAFAHITLKCCQPPARFGAPHLAPGRHDQRDRLAGAQPRRAERPNAAARARARGDSDACAPTDADDASQLMTGTRLPAGEPKHRGYWHSGSHHLHHPAPKRGVQVTARVTQRLRARDGRSVHAQTSTMLHLRLCAHMCPPRPKEYMCGATLQCACPLHTCTARPSSHLTTAAASLPLAHTRA